MCALRSGGQLPAAAIHHLRKRRRPSPMAASAAEQRLPSVLPNARSRRERQRAEHLQQDRQHDKAVHVVVVLPEPLHCQRRWPMRGIMAPVSKVQQKGGDLQRGDPSDQQLVRNHLRGGGTK